MSLGRGTPAAVVVAAAFLLLFAVPATAGDVEDTLVARLPIGFQGDLVADAVNATVFIEADDAGLPPRLEMLFTAASARISLTNFTTAETVGGMPFDNPLDRSDGQSNDVAPSSLSDVEFRLFDLHEDFAFVVYNGAKEGATYRVFSAEDATLDVADRPITLSYQDTPEGLDFTQILDPGTFRLDAAALRYEIAGDFTFMVHGADLWPVADGADMIETGSWVDSQRTTAGPVSGPELYRSRTTQYAVVEVTDGVLTLQAAAGSQALHAGVEEIVMHIDGSLIADGAAGSITIGNETVRPRGDSVEAKGQFTLTPTYVVPNSQKQVVFALTGRIDSLAVGETAYVLPLPLAEVAAGAGLLVVLAGLSAYFWPTLKTAAIAPIVPLYAKLTKSKVLDQGTRSLIHAKVEADPGCQVKQVADEIDVSWTTAAYHLRVLRKMGLIVSRRSGRHEHFFVAGSRAASTHAVLSALQNETSRTIVETVLRNPGIIQKDLCLRMGIAPSTASGHITRLREVGAIREEREWKMRRYFAGQALREVPVAIGGLMPAPPAVAAPAAAQAAVPVQA